VHVIARQQRWFCLQSWDAVTPVVAADWARCSGLPSAPRRCIRCEELSSLLFNLFIPSHPMLSSRPVCQVRVNQAGERMAFVLKSTLLPRQDIRKSRVSDSTPLLKRERAGQHCFNDSLASHPLHLPNLVHRQPPRKLGLWPLLFTDAATSSRAFNLHPPNGPPVLRASCSPGSLLPSLLVSCDALARQRIAVA